MGELMKIGSLFSGYGGLDLAALQLFPGSSVAWHCEWDDAPSKILDHHWPIVPNHRDVTTLDWTAVEPVDILTGGYPCQPFSAAGQRKGTDDERHLWPYVRDAIRLLRPRFTLLENVAGHRSLGFDRVLGDLAEDGMHVRWTSLRASDIGAPHHRERLFILITRNAHADTEGERRNYGQAQDIGSADREVHASGNDRDSPTNASSSGPASIDGLTRCGASRGSRERVTSGDDRRKAVTDPERIGRIRGRAASEQEGGPQSPVDRLGSDVDWGSYAPAIRRWERLTRPTPAPTELNSNNKPRLNAAFAEWMMGLSAGHVTEVPGISRAHQLKAIGNGVCPQQAVAAYSSLLELGVAA